MNASDDDFERATQLAALFSSLIGGSAWGFAVIFESLDRAGLVSRNQALEVIDQALDRIDPGQGGLGGGAVLRKAAMLLREDAINRGLEPRRSDKRHGARSPRKTRS
jgi:hypothetical protein